MTPWFTSPFNTPIPPGAAVRPDSTTLIAGCGYPNWASGSWGRNVYEISTAPLVPVKVTTGWGNKPAGTYQVPIPSRAVPSDNSDGHFVVIDTAKRVSHEFWSAEKLTNGTWTADSYAVIATDGSGLGGTGGVTAAWFSLLAGMLRPSELAVGRIDHALTCAVKNTAPRFVYPAGHSDGKTANGIPLGARLQWDPADNLAWLTQPWQKVVARALQVYGVYVNDSGGSWGFTTMSAASDEAKRTPFPFGTEYAATIPNMATKMRVLA